MSDRKRTPTRQLVQVGDAHKSASDIEDNLQSQILERKSSSRELDKRKKCESCRTRHAAENADTVGKRT